MAEEVAFRQVSRMPCVGEIANRALSNYTARMRAKKLVERRVVLAENQFAELVVWHLPNPLPASTHPFKYRLAFVVTGKCVLRFDNEAGKGDYIHRENNEEPYQFTSPRKLMDDFFEAIVRWKNEHIDD